MPNKRLMYENLLKYKYIPTKNYGADKIEKMDFKT